MTSESAWIYEIHHFQLKFVSIYRKEVKIIALTYFLATLPILATKIGKFGVFEVYFKQNNKNIIFTTIFATFYFEIAVKWSKSRIFENSYWIMPKTPGKIHMYEMVNIDTIVFEIVGGGGF